MAAQRPRDNRSSYRIAASKRCKLQETANCHLLFHGHKHDTKRSIRLLQTLDQSFDRSLQPFNEKMKHFCNERETELKAFSLPIGAVVNISLKGQLLYNENYNSKREDLEEEDQGEDERNVIL